MKGLFFADMNRLNRHFFRWMFLVVFLLVYAYLDYIIVQNGLFGEFSASAFVQGVTKMSSVLPLIVGVVEIFFVFHADLKARVSWAAIGCGVKRPAIVLTKYCEVLLLSFMDVLFYFLLLILISFMTGIHLVAAQYTELIITLFVMWLKIAAYTGLSLIPVFALQGVAVGLLTYIVLFAKIPKYVFEILASSLFSFEISKYTLTDNLDSIRTYLLGGIVDPRPILITLLYIAAGCGITILIFRRKELGLS